MVWLDLDFDWKKEGTGTTLSCVHAVFESRIEQ